MGCLFLPCWGQLGIWGKKQLPETPTLHDPCPEAGAPVGWRSPQIVEAWDSYLQPQQWVTGAVQDWPGRTKLWNVGVPPSGPLDAVSFRLANALVGNSPTAAGLEITLSGAHSTLSQRRIFSGRASLHKRACCSDCLRHSKSCHCRASGNRALTYATKVWASQMSCAHCNPSGSWLQLLHHCRAHIVRCRTLRTSHNAAAASQAVVRSTDCMQHTRA